MNLPGTNDPSAMAVCHARQIGRVYLRRHERILFEKRSICFSMGYSRIAFDGNFHSRKRDFAIS